MIAITIQVAQEHWPLFVAIVAAAGGVAKFLLRDSELEAIRDRTIRIWNAINDTRTKFIISITKKALAKSVLTILGFFLLFWYSFYLLLSEFRETGMYDAIFYKQTNHFIDVVDIVTISISSLVIFSIYSMVGIGVFISLKPDLDRYVKEALNRKNLMDSAAQLAVVPLALGFFGMGMPLFAVLPYAVIQSYLLGLAIGIAFVSIFSKICTSLLFLFERVFLRLAELKDGPTYLVSFTIASLGLILVFIWR